MLRATNSSFIKINNDRSVFQFEAAQKRASVISLSFLMTLNNAPPHRRERISAQVWSQSSQFSHERWMRAPDPQVNEKRRSGTRFAVRRTQPGTIRGK